MDPFEFQERMCIMIGGYSNPIKTADRGIDGWTKDSIIQIKRSPNVGSPVIRDLLGTMMRESYTNGIVIARSFSKSAYKEVKDVQNEMKNVKINLYTLSEVLSGGISIKAEKLDYKLAIDGNKIKVINLNQNILYYSWWINKNDELWFDGIKPNINPVTTNQKNDFQLVDFKDKYKIGKVNEITCLAYNEKGKTKEVSIKVLITKKMIK